MGAAGAPALGFVAAEIKLLGFGARAPVAPE
jgi:hypothetical protein